AEELHSMKSRIFLESTGIYHFPLFCYLTESGFEVAIINPLITNSISNYGIRKVKNDKVDSLIIALLGLNPNLKISVIPTGFVLELRSLVRKYYEVVDTKSANINRLKQYLRTVFPQYLSVFSNITGVSSLMILKHYPTPNKILRAHRKTLIQKLMKASKKGVTKSTEKYESLVAAAIDANTFGVFIDSIYFNISITIDVIKLLDKQKSALLARMHNLVNLNKKELFVKQIQNLKSIPGVGFLSAVTIMCEIGDFNSFSKPKQLLAYFGLDPTVKQSGNFTGTKNHISKRGSAFARRALFAIALSSVRKKRNGQKTNPVLHDFYITKCKSKAKKVALVAVMHKITNIVFAILRDHKKFELRTPEQHCNNYQRLNLLSVA
ncbi:MAG: IS110 family transposase, partial [Clostridia bacterium]